MCWTIEDFQHSSCFVASSGLRTRTSDIVVTLPFWIFEVSESHSLLRHPVFSFVFSFKPMISRRFLPTAQQGLNNVEHTTWVEHGMSR